MKFLTLKLYDGDGTTFLGELPSFKDVSPMLTINDVGAFSLKYPYRGLRASQLVADDEREIAVLVDGNEVARYLVEDDGRSEINVDLENAVLDLSGREVSQLLDRARVYPINGAGTQPASHPFVNSTAGAILVTLITRAQSRGAIPGWAMTFDSSFDSNGQPWDTNITFEYKVNATILDVLKHLSQTLGVVDWRVTGRQLHAYNANTFMRQDQTDAVFRRGIDFSKAELNRSRRDIATVVLVEGDDGTTLERSDNSAISARGRQEGYFSQTGVTDAGTLAVIGDLQLSFRTQPKVARPITVTFKDSTPKPFIDFNIGDYTYVETGDPSTFERQRVMRMSLSLSNSGIFTGEFDFNDIFEDREVTADRLIKGALGNIGSGGATVTSRTDNVDLTTPGQVAQPSATTAAYLSVSDVRAQVSVTWPAIATNTDGTAVDDLDHYEVQWRYTNLDDPTTGWRSAGVPKDTRVNFSEVLVNQAIRIRVRAVDWSGHIGAWSTEREIITANDATPTPAPSTPVVDTTTLPLIARITWNGLDVNGAAMPVDFSHVEIHASTVNNFTPSDATYKDRFYGQTTTAIEWPPDTAVYVKFISVDRSGNKSTVSTQASGTARKAADGELGSLSVGKLIAGILNADVTVSGRIATALTGQRVEINSVGIYRWDAGGNQTVAIDNTGALLTGIFKTALTGRRIEIGASGNTGRLDFYAPNGTNSFFLAYTESTGLEAIQFGIQLTGVSNTLWNRINYNTDHGGYSNYRSNKHEFFIGGPQGAGGTETTEGANSGVFQIIQTSNYGTGPNKSRFVIGAGLRYLDRAGNGRFYIDDGGQAGLSYFDGGQRGRLTIYNSGNVDLDYWDSGGVNRIHQEGDRIDFHPANNPSQLAGFYGFGGWTGGSAVLRFASPSNAASNFKLWSDANGDWFECKDWQDINWYGIRAAAFQVNSDQSAKQNIVDYSGSGLAAVRSMRVRSYQRRVLSGAKVRQVEETVEGRTTARLEPMPGSKPVPGPIEVGLVAQEAPAQIVRATREDGTDLAIDLYQLSVLVAKAVQEIDERVTTLEGKKSV